MEEPLLGQAGRRAPLSVSELVGGVRELLEDAVGRVGVMGEVTNLRRAPSGHCYFTLKDANAQLKAVLFRGSAALLPFDPEDGLLLVAIGELTVYAARGDLQLVVRHLEPVGLGALQLAFEQLRARLEAEGLFDAERKRELPSWPRRVGVVTSASGAALRDVIQVSGQRSPATPLLLSPTRVQGERAELEIAAAIRAFAEIDDVDVILLVRGGGSLEDLAAFNTEAVARAIRAASAPVICGVGHETDVTIADLAADLRAPTPSAAAALALPDRAAALAQLGAGSRRLARAASSALLHARQELRALSASLAAHSPAARLAARRARYDGLARALGVASLGIGRARRAQLAPLAARLPQAAARITPARTALRSALAERLAPAARRYVAREGARLATAAARLDALSPLAVLGRGYAIARTTDGRVLRRASDVAPGDSLRVRVAEGEVETVVRSTRSAS